MHADQNMTDHFHDAIERYDSSCNAKAVMALGIAAIVACMGFMHVCFYVRTFGFIATIQFSKEILALNS